MGKQIADYKKSLAGYWPTAHALSSNAFSACVLFLVLLSIPVRKRFDGQKPKRLMLAPKALGKKIPFYVRDGMDISVLREMFADREYVFPESLSYHPKHIADIGAHIGAAALFFRTMYPHAKITSYEPVPANFALLQKNLSSLDNVECVHAAVAAISGTVTFYPDPIASTRASLTNPGANATGIEVPAVLFDDVVGTDVDLVKFDVEGDEFNLLSAASQGTIQKVGLYLGEIHLNIMGKTKGEFMRLFPGYSWSWNNEAIVALSRIEPVALD